MATATIGLVTGGHGWRGGRELGREGERERSIGRKRRERDRRRKRSGGG